MAKNFVSRFAHPALTAILIDLQKSPQNYKNLYKSTNLSKTLQEFTIHFQFKGLNTFRAFL